MLLTHGIVGVRQRNLNHQLLSPCVLIAILRLVEVLVTVVTVIERKGQNREIYEINFCIFSKRAQCMILVHVLNLSSLIEVSRDT